MPTLILSFAPQTREAAAAETAPRKNLRVLGSVTAKLLCCGDYIRRRRLQCFKIGAERVRLAGLGLDFDFLPGVAHFERFGLARRDGGLHQFSIPPVECHLETTAGYQAADFTRGERRGQGRQEVEESRLAALYRGQAGGRAIRVVALQQHLGDAGGGAEVAVDLKRRMCVEQVLVHSGLGGLGVRCRGDQVAHDPVGVVAIQEARPQVELPAHRPAGSGVTAENQRLLRGLEQLRRAEGGDLAAWIDRPQVGDMAVLVLGVVGVFHPLLQLAVLANLERRDLPAHGCEPLAELMLLQLWADEDRVPPWTGELELRDAETGAGLKLDFDDAARQRYTRAFDEYSAGLQTMAMRSGGRYAGVATSQSLESVIFGDLIRVRGVA